MGLKIIFAQVHLAIFNPYFPRDRIENVYYFIKMLISRPSLRASRDILSMKQHQCSRYVSNIQLFSFYIKNVK